MTKTRLASFILRKHKPNLLLLHLAELDEAEHRHSAASPEAAAAVERSDARVGELLTALRDAGIEDSTTVFIVSDHGFLPVRRRINPNVLLVKAGLLEADAKGNITGGKIATVVTGGSFFIYWPESEDLRREVDTALKSLREEGVLFATLSREAVRELGAELAIQLALEAPSGTAFDDDATGDVIRRLPDVRGTHGYLPFRAVLEASFIARGPQIKKGVKLRRILMTAIGPTLLKALGVDTRGFGAVPPLNEIFR